MECSAAWRSCATSARSPSRAARSARNSVSTANHWPATRQVVLSSSSRRSRTPTRRQAWHTPKTIQRGRLQVGQRVHRGAAGVDVVVVGQDGGHAGGAGAAAASAAPGAGRSSAARAACSTAWKSAGETAKPTVSSWARTWADAGAANDNSSRAMARVRVMTDLLRRPRNGGAVGTWHPGRGVL